jgi:hypothetical protein
VIDLETGAISSKLGPYTLRHEGAEIRGWRLPSTHPPPKGTIVVELE